MKHNNRPQGDIQTFTNTARTASNFCHQSIFYCFFIFKKFKHTRKNLKGLFWPVFRGHECTALNGNAEKIAIRITQEIWEV